MSARTTVLADVAAITRPRRARTLMRALRIIHPFPTLLNVAATAALAFVAAGGAPDAGTLATMLLVMLCAQSAIGVTNDYCDRGLDAASKPWKPIVAGVVQARDAVILAGALVVAAAALAATLGPGSFGLAMLGMGCGLAYDVRLKRTVWSALPFMVAIPVLPAWVWLTLGGWQTALWWLLPLGALIGLALHLANTLPDIDADASYGIAGLGHRLGARGSMSVAWASFGAALALSGAIAPLVAYDIRIYAATASLGALCLAASAGAFALRRDSFALQLGFGVLGAGSAALAVGWLAAVG
ncbi:MAG: UbiA family prenyltransferase [Chloroflexi bacterium]|nr:UbiA family prenyltransferase [Chloroflexota bacterium]